MVQITYQEPQLLKTGKAIYDKFTTGENVKGNFVSIISDALTVLRQQGPLGLDNWVRLDTKRSFIFDGMTESGFDFKADEENMEKAWDCLEQTAAVLRYAKYHGKVNRKVNK